MSTDTLPLFKHSGVDVPEPVENSNPVNESPDKEINRDLPSYDGWIPSSESATVAGREIGGMVYVGIPPILSDKGFDERCRAFIDPSLPVEREVNDPIGLEMFFQRGYSEMSPSNRATYLEWLASGRSDEPYCVSCMLLYFYGLERRFFLDDSPKTEKREILAEVQRLKSIYRNDYDALYHFEKFIQVGAISAYDIAHYDPVYEYQLPGLPPVLKLVIGARIARGELLSAEWVLSWLCWDPESSAMVYAYRIHDEFHALFKLRFDKRFPKGFKVNKPSKTLRIPYQSSSSEFNLDILPELDGKPLPDISGLRKPLKIALEIVVEAIRDLRKFLNYVADNPDSRGSLKAHALLPPELRPLFPSEEFEQLKLWADNIIELGGLIPVGEVVARFEGKIPDKLTKQRLIRVADTLAWFGFGFAPDPRVALRSPKIGELAMIFDLGTAAVKLEDVSQTYRDALLNIAFGAFVAHADGVVTENERKTLLKTVHDMMNLSDHERRQIIANLEWMLSVAPDMALLRRKLKHAKSDATAAIRTTLISTAHSEGVVQVKKVAAIEKIYKALELNPALVYSDLHSGGFRDSFVKERAANPAVSDETISCEKSTEGIELDTKQIAHIHSETAHASSLLGDVFGNAETAGAEDEVKQKTLFPGLGPIHAAFVTELIKKDHWTENAFRDLCSRFSLLASGALEDINEWAFENFGDALLDEHDGFEINPDIADALRKE